MYGIKNSLVSASRTTALVRATRLLGTTRPAPGTSGIVVVVIVIVVIVVVIVAVVAVVLVVAHYV
jgi:hypothetical protein